MLRSALPLLAAASITLGLVGTMPAAADINGNHVRSANIQAEPGRQLDSPQVKAVFCQMRTTGFNHVTLNPILWQKTPKSTVISKRPAKKGAYERTATDDETRQAIANAYACGLKTVLLPHFELYDGSWRAKIESSDKHQAAVTKWLLHYQAICLTSKGCDTLIIGAEQKKMTKKGAATDRRWKQTIATLNKADPKRKVALLYAAHSGDELPVLGSWPKKLDGLCVNWYPRVHDKNFTVASIKKDMDRSKAEFDAAKKKYGKKLSLCETGLRSLEFDHRYARPSGPTYPEYKAAKADQRIQAVWYEAMLNRADKWFDGIMLYRTFNATTASAGDKTFVWHGKKSEKVIADKFDGKVPR